ncbi:hypothetical protein LIER_27337 [Lithospermum erythrorhizon]|uniref:FBD domain-containing protein n=1 Tax=Lithospermum erythrorhizon TaxID=34254 RepID=A0AAV3RFQ3_LITER
MKETTRNSGVKRQESSLDRISSLPDSIRAHILLFLPTKDSVATSLLSSREFSVESLPSLVEASINLDDELKERFDGHWSSFDNLIAAIYNVKVLSLDPAFWNHYHSDHESWTKPKRVPVCILSRLKVVSIDGFYGREDQLEMVDYILQNAGLLSTMNIEAGQMNVSKSLKLCQKVLNSERKSKKCKIEFS